MSRPFLSCGFREILNFQADALRWHEEDAVGYLRNLHDGMHDGMLGKNLPPACKRLQQNL